MHCKTCTCESQRAIHLTVYAPNEKLYGSCETCGQPRWVTELSRSSTAGGWGAERSEHCGCCTHRHDLSRGGHDFTVREWNARATRALLAEDGT